MARFADFRDGGCVVLLRCWSWIEYLSALSGLMTSSDMRLSFVDIRRRPRANRRDRLCPVRGVLEIAREKGKAMRTTQRLVRLRCVVPPGMLPLSGEGPAPSGPRFAGDCGIGKAKRCGRHRGLCAFGASSLPAKRCGSRRCGRGRPSRNAASQRGGTGSVRSAACSPAC